jgi:hypothetical protein
MWVAQHKQELLCGKIFGSGRNVTIASTIHRYIYSTSTIPHRVSTLLG